MSGSVSLVDATQQFAAGIDKNGNLSLSPIPAGATPVAASSGSLANNAATATLPGVAGKTTYITGFEMTAGGATAAQLVAPTVSGVVGGPLTYTFAAPAGASAIAQPLIVSFPQPIPAGGPNTAIVVTLPALGAGNLAAATVAHGFQI